MAQLIDFESRFKAYLAAYRGKHELDEDMMEEIAPELYLRWIEAPMDELGGKSPCEYFDGISGADLIMLLGQYFFSDYKIPGLLLGRISDAPEETYPFVISLMKNYTGERSDAFRALLVEIIEEMEMPHPYDYDIDVIAGETEGIDFSEACVEALKASGDAQRDMLMAAFEQARQQYAQDCFLDILSDMPFDERVYNFALERFLYSEGKRAFYASCLGKLGSESALPHLEAALRQDSLTYFDYTAIKNAFEALGGEVDIERDFTGDKDYDALANREDS
jgi:hypothetical protein